MRAELEAYGHGLRDKLEIVALNKADALSPEQLKRQLARLRRAVARNRNRAQTVQVISAVTGAGVPGVLRAILAEIDAARGTVENKVAASQWLP